MTFKIKFLLIGLALIVAYVSWNYWTDKADHGQYAEVAQNKKFTSAKTFETTHYAISSTASPEQTSLVAGAVESFHDAYVLFFRNEIKKSSEQPKLKLTLYKNRQEFSANNKSSPWAEAYYRAPVCYAYYSDGAANPYHWMIHEATHQSNNEVAHFVTPKWINEGLAAYFGASKIEHRKLTPGTIDPNAYPIWWLSSLDLSGNLKSDIGTGKIIPLRSLVTGKGGPDIGQYVNLYYIEYWSFSHFLFHYKNGLYAEPYKQVIVEGGSLASFERIVGPLDRIELEWYGYLQKQIANIDKLDEVEDLGDDVIEVSL